MVERTDVASRLSVSLTLVLTAAAYKFVVASMLPAISYFTLLDYYVLSCSLFLFLVVIENGAMSAKTWFGHPVNTTAMDAADEVVVQSLITLFALMNIVFWVVSWRVRKRNSISTVATKTGGGEKMHTYGSPGNTQLVEEHDMRGSRP